MNSLAVLLIREGYRASVLELPSLCLDIPHGCRQCLFESTLQRRWSWRGITSKFVPGTAPCAHRTHGDVAHREDCRYGA